MKPIRILIAEDHIIVKQGLIGLFEKLEGYLVVGEATDGAALIERYKALDPDIVLCDIEMPCMNGIEASKEIIAFDPKAKILFLTAYDTDEYLYWSKKFGISGIISKVSDQTDLLGAIARIVNGGTYYLGKSDAEIDAILNKYELKTGSNQVGKHYNLTKREKDILLLIAEGKTSEEIANVLMVSKKNVDFYRMKIMNKMDLNGFAQLMKFAVEYQNYINKNDSNIS